jgi:D-3-phosphoglycerate dehydrogenase
MLKDLGCGDKFRLVVVNSLDDEDFFKEAADADGVMIVYTPMTRPNLERMPNCKVVAIYSIGVNTIDLDAATDLGICVCNVPTYCLEEVAVHTFALMLDGVRKITQIDKFVRQGKWPNIPEYREIGGAYDTRGKTYGFVSFGNIPQRISEFIKPFGINAVAYDPYVSDEILAKCGVKRAPDLESLFAQSDYISVHSPLLETTKHMISKEQFDVCKHGAILVVTGRGGVVDEAALKDAVLSGRISYAALDVLEKETGATTIASNVTPLADLDRVVITSHVAFYSEDSVVRCRAQALEQVVDILENKKLPAHLVNKGVIGKSRFQS